MVAIAVVALPLASQEKLVVMELVSTQIQMLQIAVHAGILVQQENLVVMEFAEIQIMTSIIVALVITHVLEVSAVMECAKTSFTMHQIVVPAETLVLLMRVAAMASVKIFVRMVVVEIAIIAVFFSV